MEKESEGYTASLVITIIKREGGFVVGWRSRPADAGYESRLELCKRTERRRGMRFTLTFAKPDLIGRRGAAPSPNDPSVVSVIHSSVISWQLASHEPRFSKIEVILRWKESTLRSRRSIVRAKVLQFYSMSIYLFEHARLTMET